MTDERDDRDGRDPDGRDPDVLAGAEADAEREAAAIAEAEPPAEVAAASGREPQPGRPTVSRAKVTVGGRARRGRAARSDSAGSGDPPATAVAPGSGVEIIGADRRLVGADAVQLARGGASHVSAGTVAVRQGGIGTARADDVTVTMGGVGAARADRVSVELGGIGAAVAGDVRVSQGYLGPTIAREVHVEQGVIRQVIAGHVTFGDRSGALFVLAGRVDGTVRTLLDWRGALAFGAAFGFMVGILRRPRR